MHSTALFALFASLLSLATVSAAPVESRTPHDDVVENLVALKRDDASAPALRRVDKLSPPEWRRDTAYPPSWRRHDNSCEASDVDENGSDPVSGRSPDVLNAI